MLNFDSINLSVLAVKYDLLALGATAVDELAYLPNFPAADTKTYMTRHLRVCGGLAGRALLTAAGMGLRCAYAGALDRSDRSAYVLASLVAGGVDVSHALRETTAQPVHAVILVDAVTGSRTILADVPEARGAALGEPPAEIIQGSRMLLVDHFGVPGMVRAAKIAKAAGVPILGDIERRVGSQLGELIGLVDHLILPAQFACDWSGAGSAAEAVRELRSSQHAMIAVTDGASGCWYWDRGQERVEHLGAIQAEVRDTTGCGDVFHAAYAVAVLEGLNTRAALRFATAAAAVKASREADDALPSRADAQRLLGACGGG